jgi:hypothetical protein
MWGTTLVAANAAIRLGYGVLALAAPSKPAFGRVPLAPDTEEFPDARLFIRGFAAHQVAVALVGFASLLERDLRRPGMLLAAAIDFADIAAAAVEASRRASLDSDLRDGIAFSSAGLFSALVALRDA